MRTFTSLILLCLCLEAANASGQPPKRLPTIDAEILIGGQASELEQYAAKELQRYLHQISGTLLEIRSGEQDIRKPSFVVGTTESNSILRKLVAVKMLTVSANDPGPQGYALKKISWNGVSAIAIVGSDEIGSLYGVYGLLSDYYGIGFFLGGDMLPDKKVPLRWVEVNEKKAPSMYVRGFLPWTNFPQSATSYSLEDWKFILDQMAKMRLNFIHIHNYNGELGHNEMYHNFTYKGYTSRVWMPTARQAHAWAMSPWDVNKYRFGASDLFDDYDFGADVALHNENLTNEEVFRKSASLFQQVIAYAHTRGVKVGLGLDIDLIPKDYKAQADDPEVVQARIDQLVQDYPTLDYLLCFQSENVGKEPQFYEKWRKIFAGFYDEVKKRMPGTRIAVAGWGLNPTSIATLPPDVICAPISYYSDRCETGTIYGDREYWGCPWLERDFYSSEYYYPYNLHLSNTISAFNDRAPNMKGFYCLTWRLTDAVEPKMWYVARAPWDNKKQLATSRIVYEQYAKLAYGRDAAKEITDIINQNEPFAGDYAECEGTPPFTRLDARGIFQLARFRFINDKGTGTPDRSAATYSDGYGVGKNRCEEGGECVDWIDAGEWVRFADVDFGSNATTFEARVASATEGGIIELRLDTLNGPVIGTCAVTNTGGLQQWATVRCAIKPTSGRHLLQMNFVSNRDPFGDYDKALAQLRTIDKWIAAVPSQAHQSRLKLLRSRIAAVKDHIELNRDFEKYTWSDLPGAAESWAKNFMYRVTDISSLGNVMSSQNRYVQRNYVAREDTLRKAQAVKSPIEVSARGTPGGAIVTWKYDGPTVQGFRIYRNGQPIDSKILPPSQHSFSDVHEGEASYHVSAIDAGKNESPLSVRTSCMAGSADTESPFVVVISPPTSSPVGQPLWIKVRVLDNRAYDYLKADLFYRAVGDEKWKRLPMDRKVKAVFAAAIPGHDVTHRGAEYYVGAIDGTTEGFFPATGAEQPLTLVTFGPATSPTIAAPTDLVSQGGKLIWKSGGSEAYWHRIYRSKDPDFKSGPATFVTFVAASTTSFRDNGEGFDGTKLKGNWYYRVTSVGRDGTESEESPVVRIAY
jgi:hypothetical protein